MMRKLAVAAAIAAAACAYGPPPAEAAPVEYVKVCSLYGSKWAYIPGTDTCINLDNGETRQQTEAGTKRGQSELSTRVSDTEGGLEETNQELAKTNDKVSKANKRIDDLEQSQNDLEQRFENAFEESLDGIAIAMALGSPDLVSGERFAVKFNLGTYNGANAFGFTVAGVLARTDFGRVTVSGGVATTGENTGGNVGMQLSW